MSKILITGSSSGLGLAMAEALFSSGHEIFQFDHEFDPATRLEAAFDQLRCTLTR